MSAFERALKDNIGIRITFGDKWLVWNRTWKQWIVYQRKSNQKETRLLTETDFEEIAINILTKGE